MRHSLWNRIMSRHHINFGLLNRNGLNRTRNGVETRVQKDTDHSEEEKHNTPSRSRTKPSQFPHVAALTGILRS